MTSLQAFHKSQLWLVPEIPPQKRPSETLSQKQAKSYQKRAENLAWCYRPLVSVPGKLRQAEASEFKASPFSKNNIEKRTKPK